MSSNKNRTYPLMQGILVEWELQRLDLKLESWHKDISGIDWLLTPGWRVQPFETHVEFLLQIKGRPKSGTLADMYFIYCDLLGTFQVDALEELRFQGKFKLPPELWAFMAQCVLDTMRGLLYNLGRGTVIERFPLEMYNAYDIIPGGKNFQDQTSSQDDE
jgi:hypothetical protein